MGGGPGLASFENPCSGAADEIRTGRYLVTVLHHISVDTVAEPDLAPLHVVTVAVAGVSEVLLPALYQLRSGIGMGSYLNHERSRVGQARRCGTERLPKRLVAGHVVVDYITEPLDLGALNTSCLELSAHSSTDLVETSLNCCCVPLEFSY